jgi:ABC-type multidrug transport system fused ATPase/permease subunit
MNVAKAAYGQANGYADQALSAVKVVQTYGQELLEVKNFEKYLKVWFDTKSAQDTLLGMGIGFLMTLMFL